MGADVPARWSDGTPITAHDFVRSWRRVVDPRTASPNAYFHYYLANAEEINAGKRTVEDLGVRALDDYTLSVELRAPAAFFLKMLSDVTFTVAPPFLNCADCESIRTSGAFTTREWKANERIVLTRNPHHYDTDLIGLEELVFLPVTAGATAVSL